MHKIVCDKCLRDDLPTLRPERHEVKIQLPGRVAVIHLCEACRGRFIKWIDTPDPREAAARG